MGAYYQAPHPQSIDEAYIFGSVTRVGKSPQNSDIDVAVENIHPGC